jgi:hypothetical protein
METLQRYCSAVERGSGRMTVGKAVTVVILGLWSSVSFAQDGGRDSTVLPQRGTAQEEAACRRDVRRFCRHIPDSAGSLFFLTCLKENRSKISKACQNVLTSHGQ